MSRANKFAATRIRLTTLSRLRRRENPERLAWQLEPALTAGRRIAIAAQAQLAQLEKILAPVAQEHARDQLGPHAIVGGAVGDLRAFEADDAGGGVAGLELTARNPPQPPAVTFQQRAAIGGLRD